MEKPEKPNKILYLILSVLIACSFWFYVRNVDNSEKDLRISNIPITIVGEDVLEANNLMISGGRNSTVSLLVQGRLNTVSRLNNSNITIRVDVSKVTMSGEQPLGYDYVLPAGISNDDVRLLERDPYVVTLTIAKRVTKSVEVRGVFPGDVAQGFQAGEFSFLPATVEVSGREELVNQVSYALVTLPADTLSESFREDMPVALIGFDGLEITQGLTANPATVQVTLPVVMVKTVPLTIDILSGGGATQDDVTLTITPAEIIVSGAEEDLLPLKEINLGVIDLAKLVSSDTRTFTIPLAAELTNVTGINEASVSVKIKDLATKTLETDNIELINTPNGQRATAVTQSVQVLVRGEAKALELVLPQHVRVVADLKDLSLPRGQNIVPVKVYLDGGTGAGIVGEYKIAITIS